MLASGSSASASSTTAKRSPLKLSFGLTHSGIIDRGRKFAAMAKHDSVRADFVDYSERVRASRVPLPGIRRGARQGNR